MQDYYYLLISLFFFAIFLIYRNGFNRHKRNVRTAGKVIKKLEDFEYDGAKLNYLRKIDPFVFANSINPSHVLEFDSVIKNTKQREDFLFIPEEPEQNP